MDTKLKKWHEHGAVRVILFALCVAFIAAAFIIVLRVDTELSSAINANGNAFGNQTETITPSEEDIFMGTPWFKSQELEGTMNSYVYSLVNASEFKATINALATDAAIKSNYQSNYAAEMKRVKDSGALYFVKRGDSIESNIKVDDGEPADLDKFKDSTVWMIYKDGTFSSSNENFRVVWDILNQTENEYIITIRLDADEDGSQESVPGLAQTDGDQVSINVSNVSEEELQEATTVDGTLSLYLAFPEDTIAAWGERYDSLLTQLREQLILVLAMLLAALILFIVLLIITGRRRADGSRRRYALDRIFTEIQLAAIVLIPFGFLYILSRGLYQWVNENATDLLPFVASGVLFAGAAILELWFILSCVRNLKAGVFLKNALLYRVFFDPAKRFFLLLKKGFDGTNPLAKSILMLLIVIGVSILGGLLIGGGFTGHSVFMFFGGCGLFLITLGVSSAFISRWANRYNDLKKGVEEIANGTLEYKIDVAENPSNEFDKLSQKVNCIGGAMQIAVRNEIKNQRMKTDLITGVSHDLKTPLTSIISYTDLLKKEGLDSENAAGYLDIIEEKSSRLKKLTEDLFAAAKASSGDLPVNLERVDLLTLMKQTIAEMSERFSEKGLALILTAENEHYYVNADSQLLWRITDNLFSNVYKYAMNASRVYVDLRENGMMTQIEIKNISATPLNIPTDELMERFKRGDDARTTEGSGLGLSIAKDLAQIQRGSLDIGIDGDLFKASVCLVTWRE